MPKRPSEEEIERSVATVQKLVSILQDGARRAAVQGMLDGEVGEAYFTAPASSREEFHSCFPGGLVVHSLNVVGNLRKLSQALCPGRFEDSTLALVGLLHDLGKAELYVPNPSEWHRSKGMLFEVDKGLAFMGPAERSLYLLQEHGIRLSEEEYLAIRLSEGQAVEANKDYRFKEPTLALLLASAKRFAVDQEKSGS